MYSMKHVSMKWALREMALLQEVFSTKWFSRQSVVQQSVSGAVRAMSFNVKIEQSTGKIGGVAYSWIVTHHCEIKIA